ncbi:MAG TPA: hypothetical protein VFU42_00575, partial [Candidatus Deferrimicrobiaceae bacterium]|nr:hypothetical protein [Candidatus Deferrimicrobiaceae bacterium]
MTMPFSLFPGRPWTLLLVACAGYCALVAFAYLRQDKLLYFPDVYPPAEGASRAKALGFRFWPENTAGYHGFVHAYGPPSPKGVILLFHGNAGTALDRSFYAGSLAPLGYLLIVFEYPGYGARGGKPGEASFVSAAVAGYCAIVAFAYLRQDKLLYFPDVYPPAEGASRAKALGFRLWPENPAS